jgi:hypothetical protein
VNFRERYLLIAICGFIALVLGFVAFRSISGMFAYRYGEVARLEREVKEAKRYAQAGEIAKRKIVAYEARSLPSQPEVTRREYQNWLHTQIERVGMSDRNVDVKSPVGRAGDFFVKHEFTVTAKGKLPQVVELLHAFYSQDWLHRITRLSLQPIKDTKLMNVSLTVDTLSLKNGKDAQQLELRPSKRLLLADNKAYYDTIVGRNLFGPANNPPRVSVSGVKQIYLGRTAELTVKASDADPLDKAFTYRLLESDSKSAKLDPASGRFTWTPNEPGNYEFVVEATDDGFPMKTSRPEKFVINVSQQRTDRPPVVDDGFKGFDHSKFTILTAILASEAQREIWLHNRPAGEMLKLHPGDRFEIGSIKGTIAEIGEYDFSFDSGGKRRKVEHGENLFSARVVGDTPAPATQPAAAQPAIETSTTAPPESKAPDQPPSGESPAAEDGKAG